MRTASLTGCVPATTPLERGNRIACPASILPGLQDVPAKSTSIRTGAADWLLRYHRKKGETGGMFDTKVANYVFSRKPSKRAAPGAEFASERVKPFAQRLRATPGKHIWMMGGGEWVASFLDAGEIDEFDIHVIPDFIGKGIPLMAPRHRDVPLRLRSVKK